MELRHAYHKFFSNFEKIAFNDKISHTKETKNVCYTLAVLSNRAYQLGRSISMMYEVGYSADCAILTRTLFETAVRLCYIAKDKNLSKSKSDFYLSDIEFKHNIVKDIKKLNLNIDPKEVTKMVDGEKSKLIKLLNADESYLNKKSPSIRSMSEELGLLAPYGLYYRVFSQYVHSKKTIFEIESSEKMEFLGSDAMMCSCLLWIQMSNYLNGYYNLNFNKDIKSMHKNFSYIMKKQNKKRYNS